MIFDQAEQFYQIGNYHQAEKLVTKAVGEGPTFELLKKRTLGLVGCLMSAPIALVPVGGAASKLLLELPFCVRGVVAPVPA